MEPVRTTDLATPDLAKPVFVEGLSGVGMVGRFAANFLVESLDSTPVRRLYSRYFPPVLTVDEEGTASMSTLTVYAVETDTSDLLVLTGYGQADDAVGQYHITDAALDVADEFDASEIIALGGAIAGASTEPHTVVGTAAEESEGLKRRLTEVGVPVRGAAAPETIGGVSGLLLGLGHERGYPGAALLGATADPEQPDPKSGKRVVATLQELLEFDADLDAYERHTAALLQRDDGVPSGRGELDGLDEDLRYFG